jgi:hypothetical protein
MKYYDLYLQQFCSQFQIDLDCFTSDNTKITSHLANYTHHELVRMEHRVYCGKPQKEVYEVKYPEGWWNAFKSEYPRLCRWFAPVKYVTIKVSWEGRLAFPEIPIREHYKTVAIWNCPEIEELR